MKSSNGTGSRTVNHFNSKFSTALDRTSSRNPTQHPLACASRAKALVIGLVVTMASFATPVSASLVFDFTDDGNGQTLVTASGTLTLSGLAPPGPFFTRIVGWDNIDPFGVDNSSSLVGDSDTGNFLDSTLPGFVNMFAATPGPVPLTVAGVPLESNGLWIDGEDAVFPFFALVFPVDLPQSGSVVASGTTTVDIAFSDLPYPAGSAVDLLGNGDIIFNFGTIIQATCFGLPLDVDMNLGQMPAPGNVSQVIGGTPGDDIIEAFGGDDIVCGFDGFDEIFGGSGDDMLFGGDGFENDTTFNDLYGGTGDDILLGGLVDEQNFLFGQGGSDELFDGTFLVGGSGGDLLVNSFRTSTSFVTEMRGGGNNDTMVGSLGADIMNGGPGLDFMEGGDGDDTMSGGNARDEMFGGDGNDTMNGGSANDQMFGELGDDIISGNQGNDTIDGGPHILGDSCDGGGQTTADTQINCEVTGGFPAPSAAPPARAVRQGGRAPLTEQEIELIDQCNFTVDQCLGTNTRTSR